MEHSSTEPRVHLEIGSRLENVELVQIAVEAALRQLSLEEEMSSRIGTAVREAVANAIQHGNRSDASKSVKVEFGLEGNELVIQVSDEGPGFDLESVPDPLDPANLLKPDGRGILLMNEFMDSVQYSFNHNHGTTLEMRKQLEIPQNDQDRQSEEEEDA